MLKIILFVAFLFMANFVTNTWLDFSFYFLLALTLILHDWFQDTFSSKRTIGFIGLSIATYLLIIELRSIDMLIYLVMENAIHLNVALLIMGVFIMFGWGLYRFERSWKHYQANYQAMPRHPSL